MAALPLRNIVKSGHRPVEDAVSRLSAGMRIDGRMQVEGEMHIHGRFSGRIDADVLAIAPDGIVVGDVVAREVHVSGTLEGRIFAHNVIIAETATVTGRVFHHTIAVEKGARIDARMPWRPLNYFETLDQLPEART